MGRIEASTLAARGVAHNSPSATAATHRCSCTTTISVNSWARALSTKSLTTRPPRFRRCEFGNTSFSSLANCARRDEGSRDVVMSTFGGITPALAYSSSICVRGTAVLSSSSAISRRRLASSARTSVGMGFPSSSALRIFRFFSYCSASLPSRDFRYRYSLRRRALRLSSPDDSEQC